MSYYERHPKNKYTYGSPEFWQEEYKLRETTHERYWNERKQNAPKCPHCGAAKGFSFGTGDCGCEVDY